MITLAFTDFFLNLLMTDGRPAGRLGGARLPAVEPHPFCARAPRLPALAAAVTGGGAALKEHCNLEARIGLHGVK